MKQQHFILKFKEREWKKGVFHNSEYQPLWKEQTPKSKTEAFIVKLNASFLFITIRAESMLTFLKAACLQGENRWNQGISSLQALTSFTISRRILGLSFLSSLKSRLKL